MNMGLEIDFSRNLFELLTNLQAGQIMMSSGSNVEFLSFKAIEVHGKYNFRKTHFLLHGGCCPIFIDSLDKSSTHFMWGGGQLLH